MGQEVGGVKMLGDGMEWYTCRYLRLLNVVRTMYITCNFFTSRFRFLHTTGAAA